MPIPSIRQLTRYRYRNRVALGERRMMFRPREIHNQRILDDDPALQLPALRAVGAPS
jgi:hypothetical protein